MRCNLRRGMTGLKGGGVNYGPPARLPDHAMGSLIRYRFGVFELDPDILELRKARRLVRLRPQGLKLLKLLVSRPREVIAREEMARSLWDAGVFVDFEQGLNHTINQVRAALGDDAESPR